MNPSCSQQRRFSQTILGFASILLAACGAVLAAGPAPDNQPSAKDAATQSLLDKLDERQMPDVTLWVLERIASDPEASAALKAEVPFRRAAALVGTSRTESDSKKRAAIFDAAEKEIDQFLAGGPEGRRAIDAFSQKGNLLIQRGRMKVDQAKRPGEDAVKVRGEAVGFFDGAIKSLQGSAKPGQPIEKVTNAEDGIVKSLREIDAKIAEIKGPKDADDKGDAANQDDKTKKPVKPKPAVKRTAAAEKQLEQLEEEQEVLRSKLLSTRLMVAEVYAEKAKAFEPKSKEWQTALEESARRHKDLADKYANKGAGMFARYYEGRNYALLGKNDEAVRSLAGILSFGENESRLPLIASLKSKSLATALECWLEDKKYDQFDEPLLKFALTPVKAVKPLDAEWLALKYRAAALLDARADALPANEKAKKGILQRDAKKLATEVATVNKEFAAEARELAAKLGKLVPEGEEERTFATVLAEGRVGVAAMQEKQAAAKKLVAEGKAAEAGPLLEQAAAARDKALKTFEESLKMAEDGKQDEGSVNSARYMITYLLYDAKRFREAAEMGGLLAEKYPNAMGSRQAARIGLASMQQLIKESDAASVKDAKARMFRMAETIAATWPNEPEGGDALAVLISAAIESRDADAIVKSIQKLPKESLKRPELLQRAGAALWREVQEKRRLEDALRPAPEKIEAWKADAKAALDEGLAAAADAPPTKFAVAAALSRAQMAIEDGDMPLAGQILEHKSYGPWATVQGGGADFSQGALAEGSLTVALRYFIQTEQVDKAQQAMDGLEKVAGDATKLTSLYLSMGRDLQGQLDALGAGGVTPEAKEKAAKILAGFEKFLDKVADRDDKISSQMWVATTYLSLGSGEGTGAIVPKDKAQSYLDRAAAVYGALLKKGGDEISKFEPSIRLKMATIFRERQKWPEAQEQIDWILADAKRQNSLDTQVQAADLLQSAGQSIAAQDPAKADGMIREATVGRKTGGAVIWGWGGIANKLSRQVGGGGKADDQFYEARLNIAKCMLARAILPGKPPEKKEELLREAKKSIAVTRKLYPALGGESVEKKFEKLLKDIQKQQGDPAPKGFKEFDEQEAAPAKPVATAQ